jgi:hypothetical protein
MNPPVPESLVAFRPSLEAAIRRERTRRRRKLALRAAVVAAVVASLAVGALSIVSRPASGASVVRRAAEAIAASPGTILHVDMVGSQTNGDGSVVSWRDESWQQEGAPWARRQVETGPDGSVVESGSSKTSDEVYDPATGTIYVSTHSAEPAQRRQSYKIAPGPRAGTFVLRLAGPGAPKVRTGAAGTVRPYVVITARQAQEFRAGKLVVGIRISKENGAVSPSLTLMRAPKRVQEAKSSPPEPDPSSGDFRDQILALLNSGGAKVAGRSTIDGREVIEIDSADGRTTYFVDPAAYAPVELRTRGTDGGTTLRFRTYETLPLAGNGDLLSLEAQHPTANVDRDLAHYQAAETRLFPHG